MVVLVIGVNDQVGVRQRVVSQVRAIRGATHNRPRLDHITGLLQSITGVALRSRLSLSARGGAINEIDLVGGGVHLIAVDVRGSRNIAAVVVNDLDHDGGDFTVGDLVPNGIVGIELDGINAGGEDLLLVVGDAEDLAVVSNAHIVGAELDGAVGDSIRTPRVNEVGSGVVGTAVVDRVGAEHQTARGGRGVIDVVAVLAQTGDQRVIRDLGGGVDLGDLTVDDGVVGVVIVQSIVVRLVIRVALDEDDILAGGAEGAVGVDDAEEDLGVEISARVGAVSGISNVLISINSEGGNVGNADIAGNGLGRGIPEQEHGLAVGIQGSITLGGVACNAEGRVAAGGISQLGGALGNEVLSRGDVHLLRLGLGDDRQLVDTLAVDLVGDDVVQVSGSDARVIAEGNDLAGAVEEQQLRLVNGGHGARTGADAVHADDHGVGIGSSRGVDPQGVAVLVKIDRALGVHGVLQAGDDGGLGAGNIVDLVGGGADVDGLADGVSGQVTDDLLGSGNALDAVLAGLVGVGEGHEIAGLVGVVSGEVAAGAGLGSDGDVSVLGGGGSISRGDLAKVGVGLGDDDGVIVSVIEDFGQNAVAAEAVGGVALVDVVRDSGLTSTVNIVGDVGDGDRLGQAEVGIDGAELDFRSIGQVSLVGVGTDLGGLEVPLVSGTLESIGGRGAELEVGVELLAQLDDTILGAIVGGILTDVPNAVVLADDIGGLGAAEVDHSAVDRDGGTLGGILDHGGLEGVEHHLSGLLTGQRSRQGDLFHAFVQIRVAQGQFGGVDGPAVAHQVLDLGVIAQSHQQHLGKLGAQHGSSGVETAVAVASQNAFVGAVSKLMTEENMKQLTDGTAALKAGVKSVDDGVGQLQAGMKQVNGLVENALQQQNELKALLANDSLTAEQKAAVKEALTALSSVDIVTNGKADGEYDKDGKADLAAGLASIKAATDTKSKEQNLYNGAAALDTTAQTMSGYAAQLRGSATQLLDGEKTVRDAITQISTNITKLSKGGKTLTANNKKLKSGAAAIVKNSSTITTNSKKLTKNSSVLRKGVKQLAAGTKSLFAGTKQLDKATGTVSSGISKLYKGSDKLNDGMNTFKKDAIDKLATTITDVTDGLDGTIDRIKGIQKASEDYQSFSGIDNDMNGSVKFVLSTQEVKKDE
mgnify:CR=1 FL=1